MVTVHKLHELAINVLQGLVVRLEGVYQRWTTIQDSLWQNRATDSFQPRAPRSEVRALMRGSEKKDTIG